MFKSNSLNTKAVTACMIEIDVSGIAAKVRGKPTIVCDNSGYVVHFNLDAAWSARSDAQAKLTKHTEAEDSTQLITISEQDTASLSPLSGVYAIEIALVSESAHAETAPVWIDCTESILSYSGTTTEPYDVYNAIMEWLNPQEGRTQDEILAEIKAHYENPPEPSLADYKVAVAQKTRYTKLTGKLTLTDGTEVELDGHNFTSGTLRISSSMVSGDFLLPGGVPAAELTASMIVDTDSLDLYKAKIELTEWLETAPFVWYPVPLGCYTIYAMGNDSETGIPITAYDAMKKLDEKRVADLKTLIPPGIVDGKAYSPNQIIGICARYGGVEYEDNVDTAEFVNSQTHSVALVALGVSDSFEWEALPGFENTDEYETDEELAAAITAAYGQQISFKGSVYNRGDLPAVPTISDVYRIWYDGNLYVISDLSDQVQTLRDLLMHTVATINAFAYIDRQGKLRIKGLSSVPYSEPTIERALTTHDTTRSVVSRAEYKLLELTTTYEDSQHRSVPFSDMTNWSDGVTAELPHNPMWTVLDESTKSIRQSLISITQALDPVTFYPVDVAMYTDARLGLYDWVTVKGVPAPITSYSWQCGGTEGIECCGSEAAAGIIKSQMEKAADAASAAATNTMRDIYRTLMHTYQGMQNFTYVDIEHYTYKEIEEE